MLTIQSQPFEELDEFALLACQKDNFGNTSDWFGCFRGGLYAFYGRVFGIGEHFRLLHEWLPPRLHLPESTEYHVSSTLFHMDSAVECLTFAFNALGFAVYPEGFRDVTESKWLKNISPWNIIGERPTPASSRKPLSGYMKVYPRLQSHFVENLDLLGCIFELHDVSKHRETVYAGGRFRLDDPPGYFEAVGLKDDPIGQIFVSPQDEVSLRDKPKEPRGKRTSNLLGKYSTLEKMVPPFLDFLQKSCELALIDVRENIPLSRSNFPPEHTPLPYNHVPNGIWK